MQRSEDERRLRLERHNYVQCPDCLVYTICENCDDYEVRVQALEDEVQRLRLLYRTEDADELVMLSADWHGTSYAFRAWAEDLESRIRQAAGGG